MYESLTAERLGKRIAEMRVNRGMNKVQFAKQLGITRQKLSELERGSTSVAMSYYCRALNHLGCELEVIPRRFPTLEELSDVFA